MVTLNPEWVPAAGSVFRRMGYAHPVYTRDSVATQADLPRLNGVNHTIGDLQIQLSRAGEVRS